MAKKSKYQKNTTMIRVGKLRKILLGAKSEESLEMYRGLNTIRQCHGLPDFLSKSATIKEIMLDSFMLGYNAGFNAEWDCPKRDSQRLETHEEREAREREERAFLYRGSIACRLKEIEDPKLLHCIYVFVSDIAKEDEQ